jgi:hypothetical protein
LLLPVFLLLPYGFFFPSLRDALPTFLPSFLPSLVCRLHGMVLVVLPFHRLRRVFRRAFRGLFENVTPPPPIISLWHHHPDIIS